ncbi:ATP-dependent helicase HrpB [Marinospirillum perlucidum]|uniref:ATP-dependent helicase HrpB n=1 Tax=Marinospirillum perlucidum TaxID=1982602 RepID=UPI000DF20354|nr:ATP-dependent helicase HrpB [Marinospirillum perlucidum]
MSARTLPIDAYLPQLVSCLQQDNTCLLVAEPGAGKTTSVPLALMQQEVGEAGCWLLLEPRRVAARLAAGFMAETLGEELGKSVGFRVRGESRASASTRLLVVTQGVLTRWIQEDPLLEGVAGIIFDEFHERSLEADLGLALAREVQETIREDLKLLVMSATLDVDALTRLLGEKTPVIRCPGRSYPITRFYRPPPLREDASEHQARVIREALQEQEGDLLVFLPGQVEIRRLQQKLEVLQSDALQIQPLYGQLPLAQQKAVVSPPPGGVRRIILSTALAESSLTLPGIRVVIDAGRERLPVFQPRSGLTRLTTQQVNQASADQREGRAGREAPGCCYRLWSREQPLVAHREPEILQADLSGLAFELARWGIKEATTLNWVTPPPAAALQAGRDLLRRLGVLDAHLGLTALGQGLARWSTHPRLGVLLEKAKELQALPLAAWLVAWLEEGLSGSQLDLQEEMTRLPDQKSQGEQGRWRRTARLWAERLGCRLEPVELDHLPDLLLAAYPDRLAFSQGEGRYKLITGGQLALPEQHPLARNTWLVAVNLDGKAQQARVYQAVALPEELVQQRLNREAIPKEVVFWNSEEKKVVAEEQLWLGQLLLKRRPLQPLAQEKAAEVLIQALRSGEPLPFSAKDQQLLGRLRLAHRYLGEPWPALTPEALLETLDAWLLPRVTGMTRLDELARQPLGQWLLESLDWSLQQQLSQLLPERLEVPSGSSLPVDYSGEEPVLAVKLQEVFGWQETPRLLQGRVPLVIHLLSPAGRPVQITRDLASFWKKGYFEVRKDLRGRYPKHPWPDDPLTAEATRKTRRATQGR